MEQNEEITTDMKRLCLGVFREAEHSPERVEDDELILKAVGHKLQEDGRVKVEFVYPSRLKEAIEETVPELVFNMAEEEPVLCLLEGLERRGVQVVNSTMAVRNTFRKEMTTLLSGMNSFPETTICSINTDTFPDLDGSVWVKRGDFHAIDKEDVRFAKDATELSEVLGAFSDRGIETVAIQRHVPGDLIKFYGVRHQSREQSGKGPGTLWFHWFYHRDQEIKNYRFDSADLQRRCEEGADMLGLEIFGGDAIVTEGGDIYVIDVNAWPSFALFREEASGHIAAYLLKKLF